MNAQKDELIDKESKEKFMLGQAEQIAKETYGDAVADVHKLENSPTKITTKLGDSFRWEFKVSLKSNTAEIEKEMYLNIFELSEKEKLKRSRLAGNIDMDKKPVYEFVEKD